MRAINEKGFTDCRIVPQKDLVDLTAVYPNMFTLLSGKKNKLSKNVPRGWVSYRNRRLTICSGKVRVVKSKAPKGTAYDGDQYCPENDASVLFVMDVAILSLQQFFGVVEGLLSTLK
jgi:hypothetical protein